MESQLSFSNFITPECSFPRGGWREVLDSLESLGPDGIADRWETSRRMIREQGVTCYASAGTEDGCLDRLWELDIVPAVIGADQWRDLETGLKQRARLLNAVVRDLYGLQHSLRNGWLPAPLVYANPQFLRSCQGVPVDGCPLPFYAADLAQSSDGRWWVLADRAQAPAGIGFALKNRAIVSRVLPEAMREVQPHSLNHMFPLIREALVSLAVDRTENPTVVVMTPGPKNEAYFEHAYLSRALGFTLVEGGDLTVRDRRVFIKTLEGLRPVDVILRRVSDAFCDPLELQANSLLGVPGLVEAVRAGSVSIANSLGCGIVETPALMAFLPNLSRQMLGEELLLPSVATWWCGGLRENRYVAENMERLALRSAFAGAEQRVSRDALLEQFRTYPHQVIAQEEIVLSQIPALKNGGLSAAPYIIRAFVICENGAYHVMPGGLVRLPHRGRTAAAPTVFAGGSKDLWVVANGATPVEREHAAGPPSMINADRSPIDLPSRAADNLFWLGRYTERLESLLRIARRAITVFLDDFDAAGRQRFFAVADLLSQFETISSRVFDPGSAFRDLLARDLIALLSQPGVAGGARDLIGRIHQSAFAVRDRLSSDIWRLISQIEGVFPPGAQPLSMLQMLSVLDTLILNLAAFSGMEMENMTRGHGWVFLNFGRRLERSRNVLGLLNSFMAVPERFDLLMEPVLEICDSVITYRQRHFAELHVQGVLDLLLFDPGNPRSLAFQFAAMRRAAADLPDAPNPSGAAAVRGTVRGFSGRLEAFEPEADAEAANRNFAAIASYLSSFVQELSEVSELVTLVYFSHSIPRIA